MKNPTHNYFGNGLKAAKTESFGISITSYAPSTTTPLHHHKNPYLCLLIDGMYEEENRNKKRFIEAGSVLYREAGNEHANVFSNAQGRCLNIELLSPDQLMLENNLTLPTNEVERNGSKEVYSLLQSLRTNQPQDILNIQCYEALVAHLDLLPVFGNPKWIQLMKELIHDEPFSEFSLSKLSLQFNLHPNYIVRKFKQQTGFKLSEYVVRIRLESAVLDMLRTGENLTSIALGNGFYDQSHFIKHFKKHFGSTPLNFRKNLKG